MAQPGFTAEYSLGASTGHYRSGNILVGPAPRLVAAEAIHGVSCQEICRSCGFLGLSSCCTTICGIGDIELPIVR